jgi:hypothetical protein
MTTRTTKSTVTFQSPVLLDEFDEVLPPGTYDVETDEELLEGLSFDAYKRVQSLIHLPGQPGHQGFSRTLIIDPNTLDEALTRDRVESTTLLDPSPTNLLPNPEE